MLVSHRTYSKTEYRKAACYIRRYLIHLTSHRAPLVCWVDCVGLATKGLVWHGIARYKIIMHRSSLVYHGISHMSLVVPSYWENTSDSWDFPWYATPCHSMPLGIRISWVSSVTSRISALWPRVNWSESKNIDEPLLRRVFAIAPEKALRTEMLATQAVFESIVWLKWIASYRIGRNVI